jgi:hypothetical protein
LRQKSLKSIESIKKGAEEDDGSFKSQNLSDEEEEGEKQGNKILDRS